MDRFLDKPVYVLLAQRDLEENTDNERLDKIIMSIFSTREDAIKVKENEERRTKGFGEYCKYYVEAWRVHAPNVKLLNLRTK